MPKARIEQLRPGLVVADDVKNIDDMLLIPGGATLSERHIDILRAWGVAEVNLQSAEGIAEETDPLAELPAEVANRLVAEVRGVFRDLNEADPVAQEIFKVILHRHVRRYGNGCT